MANDTESCSKDETLYVTTLTDSKKRREKLLEITKMILHKQSIAHENTKEFSENLPNIGFVNTEKQKELNKETEALAYCDTTTFSTFDSENPLEIGDHDNVSGPMTSTNNLISHGSEEDVCTEINNELSVLGFEFSSDDSVADPNYCPLSKITNVVPLVSTSTVSNNDWFSETILEREVAVESRIRKRKTEVMSTKRLRNKKLRMLGQEYIGFRRTGDDKFSQDCIMPARKLGESCNSSKCLNSKVFNCDKFTETVRLNIFNKFWKMTWIAKKMFVSSLVDRKPTKRKTTEKADTRRSTTKFYYLKLNDQKMRVCLKTFLGTLGIKEWTVRYKTTLKESPQKFKKPLSLLRGKPEKVIKDEIIEQHETSEDVTDMSELEESVNLLKEYDNGHVSPIKSKAEKNSLLQGNESISLLQQGHRVDAKNMEKQFNSPSKRPLAENLNFGNVAHDTESSISILRRALTVNKMNVLDENSKRTKSDMMEPLYKEPTVRKKSEKRALPGWSCDECKKFYGELYKDNPEMLVKKMDECSKHRGKNNPVRPKTPPGFWNPRWDVPENTEEFNRRNNAV